MSLMLTVLYSSYVIPVRLVEGLNTQVCLCGCLQRKVYFRKSDCITAATSTYIRFLPYYEEFYTTSPRDIKPIRINGIHSSTLFYIPPPTT